MRTHARIKIDQSLRFSWLCLFPLVTISASPFAEGLQKYFKKAPGATGGASRRPRLAGGVRGCAITFGSFLAGKPRPLKAGSLASAGKSASASASGSAFGIAAGFVTDPYCR
jgi:hypothetical protein